MATEHDNTAVPTSIDTVLSRLVKIGISTKLSKILVFANQIEFGKIATLLAH